MTAPFLIEHQSGEILTVQSMYDADGTPVTDRAQARQFGVIRENGKPALLRLSDGQSITKIERQ